MPALPLTPEQKAESANLKMLFKKWQAERKARNEPANQDFLSESLGFGQSALSQYLNGRIPLNAMAAAKFAGLLGCRIEDFSPSVAASATTIAQAVAPTAFGAAKPMEITDLNKLETQLVLMFRELPVDARDELLQHANRLHNHAKPDKSKANPFAGVPPPPTSKKIEPKPPKAPALKKPKQHA